MIEARGQWSELWRQAAEISTDVVELSALSGSELPGLIEALGEDRPPFEYVSVHAPTKKIAVSDERLVETLLRLPEWIPTIVLHPDAISHPAAFRLLGSRAVLENMDARKPFGTTVEDLDRAFAAMPEAGFCLDLAHVASVDPSMRLGHAFLDAFSSRLRQVHLSSLDENAHHAPLTTADVERFAGLLQRCGQVPIVLEARPPRWMWIAP